MLVVGATGVLRPAALSLAAMGWAVVALARDPARLDELAALDHHITPLAVDVHDGPAVRTALASEPLGHGVDDALVYLAGPDDDAENAAIDRISIAVTGTVVRILTSRWTPPDAPEMTAGRWPRSAGRRHLLLGVHAQENGRWHTAEEISTAAIQVLTDGPERLLGSAMLT